MEKVHIDFDEKKEIVFETKDGNIDFNFIEKYDVTRHRTTNTERCDYVEEYYFIEGNGIEVVVRIQDGV